MRLFTLSLLAAGMLRAGDPCGESSQVASATAAHDKSASAAILTIGTWKLNVQKSKLPERVLAAVMIQGHAGADALHDTIEYRYVDGRSRLSVNPFVVHDGKEHVLEQTTIITGADGKQEITFLSGISYIVERVDERRSRVTMKKGGKLVQGTERELSPDGKTLTVVRKFPDDSSRNSISVWEKQ